MTGALVVVVTAVALAAGGALVWQHYVSQVDQMDLLGEAARARPTPRNITIDSAPQLSAPADAPSTGPDNGANPQNGTDPRETAADGSLNILLVGIDQRADSSDAGARADSVIVVHVTAARDHAYLISLPRDTRVTIPAYPKNGFSGGTDKLNAAFSQGFGTGGRASGFELLALTVRKLTGLSFDAGAIIDFGGLKAVVDAVGGVDLCVDAETVSVHVGWDALGHETAPYRLIPPSFRPEPIAGVRPQVYHVGCQHLNGWQALDFVRQRELLPDGDYGRQRHQQQLIAALSRKLTSTGLITNPLALGRALDAIGSALTFDGNGRSVTDWILTLRRIDPNAITMLKTNGGHFHSTTIGGQSFERLDDTTRELFAATRDDRLASFTAAHPDWVSRG